MADVDPALVQKLLNDPKRQWEPDVEHHRQTDDIHTAMEAFDQVSVAHIPRLSGHPDRLNLNPSDNTDASA